MAAAKCGQNSVKFKQPSTGQEGRVTKQAKKKKLYRGRETGGDDDHGQAASGGVTSSSPLPLFLLAGPPARPPRDNITPSRRPRLHLLLTDTEPQPTVPPVIQSPARSRNGALQKPQPGKTKLTPRPARINAGVPRRGPRARRTRFLPPSPPGASQLERRTPSFPFPPPGRARYLRPATTPRSSCSALLCSSLLFLLPRERVSCPINAVAVTGSRVESSRVGRGAARALGRRRDETPPVRRSAGPGSASGSGLGSCVRRSS